MMTSGFPAAVPELLGSGRVLRMLDSILGWEGGFGGTGGAGDA